MWIIAVAGLGQLLRSLINGTLRNCLDYSLSTYRSNPGHRSFRVILGRESASSITLRGKTEYKPSLAKLDLYQLGDPRESLCLLLIQSFLEPSLYFLLDLGRSIPDGAFHVHCLAEPRKSGVFYVNFNSTNAWLSIPHAVCSLLV